MKRLPKQNRSRQIVDSILEATTRILSKARLKDATTNKIAQSAGVSIGSLYDYFPDKKSIAISLMDKRIEKIMTDFYELIHSRDMPLEDLIDETVEFIAQDFFERREFLREIFLLAPESGRMEVLFNRRSEATKYLKSYFVTKQKKSEAWAEWKSFFMIHSVLGLLEGYIIIEEANFDRTLMKSELKALMRAILKS